MRVTHRHGLSESHTHDAIDYAEHQRPMDNEVVESDTRLDLTVSAELPKAAPPILDARIVALHKIDNIVGNESVIGEDGTTELRAILFEALADLPPAEHRGRKSGGMLTAPTGWSAPSDTIKDAFLPPMTVKRGGLKWPDASEADYAQKFASYERHMVAERLYRQKRNKEWLSTLRVLGVLFLLALVLLGMMDALPWQ
jgi:hypothetical protein